MARTTLDLDPAVLAALRDRGRSEGKSLGRLASELLAPALQRAHQAPDFSWITADLGEPKVDLEDEEALNAALDGRS